MALQQTEEEFFAEFMQSFYDLCELLPEGSEERKKLEDQFENWEQFKREREFAQEMQQL